MGTIDAAIFDLAGTVVDFGSRAPVAAFVELFRRNGVEITTDQARQPMGLQKRDHIQAITRMPPVAEQWRRVHHSPCVDNDIERMYAAFVPLLVELLPRYGELIPGAAETIARLREVGVKVGVTTGYDEQVTRVVLQGMADQGLVPDAAVNASEVAAGRPAPWMLFRCMEKLGVPQRHRIVKVGDTLPDIEAGRNAGVWTVGVTKTGNMLGLSQSELQALQDSQLREWLQTARLEMLRAGAHAVLDSVEQCWPLIAVELPARLEAGERP